MLRESYHLINKDYGCLLEIDIRCPQMGGKALERS